MGNICCNLDTIVSHIQTPKDQLSEIIEAEFQPSINLFDVIGYENIKLYFDEVALSISEAKPKTQGQIILESDFKEYDAKVNVWGLLTPIENTSNKLHNYYTQKALSFTPDMFFLFWENRTPDVVRAIDCDLDSYEILRQERSEDMLLMVCRFRTKKMFFVASKEMLILRILKKIKENEYVEFTKSLALTNLKQLDCFSKILQEIKNQAFITSSGMHVYIENGRTVYKGYANLDILSSVGLMIIKSFIKKKIGVCHANILNEIVHFIDKGHQNKDLFWFDSDKTLIPQIIEANIGILDSINIRSGKTILKSVEAKNQDLGIVIDKKNIISSNDDKWALDEFDQMANKELQAFRSTLQYSKFSNLKASSIISLNKVNNEINIKLDDCRKSILGCINKSKEISVDSTHVSKSYKSDVKESISVVKVDFLNKLTELSEKINAEVVEAELRRMSLDDFIKTPNRPQPHGGEIANLNKSDVFFNSSPINSEEEIKESKAIDKQSDDQATGKQNKSTKNNKSIRGDGLNFSKRNHNEGFESEKNKDYHETSKNEQSHNLLSNEMNSDMNHDRTNKGQSPENLESTTPIVEVKNIIT